MAIAFTNKLGSDVSGTPATSFVTASHTPTVGTLQLLVLDIADGTGSTQPPVPTVTGNGLTWELVTSIDYDITGSDRGTLFLFRAAVGSSSAGAITVSFGATTVTDYTWILDEVSGTLITNNGADGIGHKGVVASASGSLSSSVPLSAFANPLNAAYGCWALQATSPVYSPGSFTTLKTVSDGLYTEAITAYFVGDADPAMSWTAASIFKSGAIGIELISNQIITKPLDSINSTHFPRPALRRRNGLL